MIEPSRALRPRLLMTFAAGVLAWLAFPPLNAWPLIVPAAALLTVIVDRAPRARAAFVAGVVFGTAWHGLSFTWLHHTLVTMSGLPGWAAWLGVLLFGAWQGLAAGFWALARRWLGRDGPWADLAAAVAWAALDLAWPWIFPFPLASCLYRVPLLTQAADVAGVTGLSVLVLFVAQRLAAVAEAGVTRRARALRLGVGVVLPLGLLAAYGALRLQEADAPASRTLRVGWVQASALPEEKRSKNPVDRIAVVEREWAEMERLALQDLDLMVLPEGGFTFFFQDDASDRLNFVPDVRRWSLKFLGYPDRTGVPLIFGSLRKVKGRSRNTAFVVEPGRPPVIYDKRKLVPFGERIPLGDQIPWLQGKVQGMAHLEPGAGSPLVPVAGLTAHLSICYEAIYPVTVAAESHDADLLVNLTNDEWFGKTSAPEMHLMTQTFRSIETRKPLVRVTNTGISVWFDAFGRASGRTGLFTREAGVWQVPVQSGFTLFGAAPYAVTTATLLLGMVAALLTWRRRSRSG
jgi:apolipoprotein N-acyltransferase